MRRPALAAVLAAGAAFAAAPSTAAAQDGPGVPCTHDIKRVAQCLVTWDPVLLEPLVCDVNWILTGERCGTTARQ